MQSLAHTYWPSARQFAEAIQCPAICFHNPHLRDTLPAVDRLGMPLVTSGQFAYVYKLKPSGGGAFAVRCFRGHLGDREQRYQMIDEHLRRQRIPALAGFTYEPQGILVNGRRFPILAMQWIEGPTLDVYLDEVMGRKDVLLHLADEWVRLMQSLREAGVAHGDLQHGNIIVERGQLRLVDLDGMFVPAMTGWQASEMGHQHYQHPSRDASLFNANLDDFSSLVVYLSLVSLAERPELWAEHHDENLIFTKADFLAPESSVLFDKIKDIGGEHRRLAEVLEAAARNHPTAAPSVLDLVSRKAKGKLPSWMVAPPDIDVAGRTREATPAEEAALRAATPPEVDWKWRRPRRPLPTTPGSATVQSVFSGPTTTPVKPAVFTPTDPSDIGVNALGYSKELAKKMAGLWWFILVVLRWVPVFLLDIPEFPALILTIMFTVAAILVYGLARAFKESKATPALNPAQSAQAALPANANAPNQLPFWLWSMPTTSAQSMPTPVPAPPVVQPQPAAQAMQYPIVGSRTLGIYHRQDCEWALKISTQNCVGFRSPAAAQTAGYHACQVCTP